MSEEEESEHIRLNARNLRGIAHPTRVRILGLLRADGPATATSLAARLGMNTGATSYHLRQLAEYGFVREDTARGVGKERWWKAAHRGTNFSEEELAADAAGLGRSFLRSAAQVLADNIFRAVDQVETLPAEWRGASDFSDDLLRLTPAEAKRLAAEIHGVVRRYRSAGAPSSGAAPDGSARVTVQFQLFPRGEDLSPSAGTDIELEQ